MNFKIACCFASCVFTLLIFGFSGSAKAGVVIKNGVYVIQMSNSNLTVACSSDAEHSPLILWPTRPTANWGFETTGNGYYGLDSGENRLHGGNGKKGTPITMRRTDNDWGNEMWKVVKVGRYYKFINFKTGQAMTLTSGKRTPGSRIENAPVADTVDQLFCIQRMEDVGYCGEGGPYVDYTDNTMPEKKSKMDEYMRLVKEGKATMVSPGDNPSQDEQKDSHKQKPEYNEFTNKPKR